MIPDGSRSNVMVPSSLQLMENVSPQSSWTFELAGRAVLIATDGSAGAVSAIHVALALATRHQAIIHVVSVVDTRPAPIPPPLDLALAMSDAVGGSAVHAQQMQDVRASLSQETGREIGWPVRITMGTPASAIVREAQRISAALIIVGLRRHGPVDRAIHDETALEVMRSATCPVLGVVPGTTELPVRVLAAVDFSETSLVAARTACALVGKGASVMLAYVTPLTAFFADDGELVIHNLGVQAAFAKTRQELARHDTTLDQVVLHHEHSGTPAEMLLEYADGANSDLIATGSARHGRIDRWIMGSVSTDLVRDGRHSVLVVPPPQAPLR